MLFLHLLLNLYKTGLRRSRSLSRSTAKKSRSSSSKVCYTEFNQSRQRQRKHHLKSEFALFQTSSVKRATKQVQISVLQHCCKTS